MNKRRLLKLASYLEKTRFTKKHRFDFSVVRAPTDCGTAGCTPGELPRVFPGSWKYSDTLEGGWPVPRKDDQYSVNRNARKFFDITSLEVSRLFYPLDQDPMLDLHQLTLTATPREVAANIRHFVKQKEAQ